MIRSYQLPLALAAVLASFPLPVYAQSAVDGAVGGTIRDSSGAGLSAASVVVRSNGTNAEQVVSADSTGFFRIIHLQPGTYTVTISAPGFETYKADSVTVTVGSLTNVEPHLAVGSNAETVEVNSAAPSINTTSNDFSSTVGQKVLNDVPVNNYRWSSYALLTPGVVEGGGLGLLSFRGASVLLNNITFDGADDNQAFFSEERGRTRVGYSTAKSSIQEFQVNTSNYSVEYGRATGGVVNAVTRSGTNALHGEAYFFDRDAGLGAANPFTTRAVQTSVNPAPLAFAPQVFKPKDWRKQVGFGIGGPIIKDKLFFFFAFDKFLHNFPGVAVPASPALFYTAPTAAPSCASLSTATVNGAVCALAASLNHIAPVIDPKSGATLKSGAAQVTPSQYASAATVYTNGIAGLTSLLGTTPRTGDQNIFFPKIDWQINGRNHLSAELNRLRWTSPAGILTPTVVTSGIRSFGDDFVKATFGIVKLDTSITTTLSNEVRYQYSRDFEYQINQAPAAYENATLVNPTSGPAAGYSNPFGIPVSVSIDNAFQFGTSTSLNRPSFPDERRYQIADTINLVHGRHNLKFGIDYLHTNDLAQSLGTQFGAYTYKGSNYAAYSNYFADLNTNNGCYLPTQDPTSKLYSAVPTECFANYTQGFGPLGFEFQTKDYAGFLQDEWRVSPRLSLTFGVRYDYQQQPQAQIPNPTEASIPFANGSTNVLPDNRTNIAPRIGFAIDVFGDGKTAIRGGAGEFFARLQNASIYTALAQTGTAKGQVTLAVTNSNSPFGSGAAPLFPRIVNPTGFDAASALLGGGAQLVYFDKNFKLPESLQADLTVEQNLGYNTILGLTWLASLGRRLEDFVDTNLPDANDSVSYTFGSGGPVAAGTVITIPYYRKLATSSNGRPNPNYGSTTKIFSGVNSSYNALVVQLNHRTTHNLSFSANYTWSHALDYGQNNITFSNVNTLFDPKNVRFEYGNSNQNVPNRLVAYAVYNTPSHFKGVLGYLLNNYEIAPSFQAQSGASYSPNVVGNFAGVILGSGALASGATAGAGTFGGINGSSGTSRLPNVPRNTFRFRRVVVMDARVSKRFQLKDRVDVELLAESFNIFNHLNQTGVSSTAAYGYTAGSATTPNMLTANSTFAQFDPKTFAGNANNNLVYTPRQVQLGVRVQF